MTLHDLRDCGSYRRRHDPPRRLQELAAARKQVSQAWKQELSPTPGNPPEIQKPPLQRCPRGLFERFPHTKIKQRWTRLYRNF